MRFDDIPEFRLTSFYDRNMVTQSRRFAAYLRARDIKLVHTHDFYSNVFGMAGATLAGVRARIASRRETTGLRSVAQKRLELLAFRFARAIVVNAEAVRTHLLTEGVVPSKPIVIYNGVDLNRFPSDLNLTETARWLSTRLPVALTGKDLRFVTMVANMHHEVKDHPMFLRSARRIHNHFPTATFLLIGNGKLTDSLQHMASDLGIRDHTVFLGHCDNVPDLLRLSDVCVLSSKAEGFSNAILEYMASAKPVVATDVGGAREAITEGKTGFLVKSGDDEMMGNQILRLLNDPQQSRQMGQLGRRVVEERFSCDSQRRSTEKLYEILLDGSKSNLL